MADDVCDKRRRSKKKRSSLSTWKKKFNIKKRFANKLPLHGRHIRALMSGWPLSDVRSVLTQYEIMEMLKQLSIMADKSRTSCSSVNEDLADMYNKQSCCDIRIICCEHPEEEECESHRDDHREYLSHSSLLSSRWPLISALIKSENDVAPLPNSENGATCHGRAEVERLMPTISITGFCSNKFSDHMKEVYGIFETTRRKNSPKKLRPLPTTDEKFQLRNNKSVQPFRHTILECEPQVVTRRQVVRRKQKQRFSMDEKILSNHSPSVTSRMQQSRSCKFPPNEVTQLTPFPYVQEINLNTASEKSIISPKGEVLNSICEDLLTMFHAAEAGSGDLKIIFSNNSSSNFTPWLTPHSRRRDFSNHYQAWISHYESSSFYSPSSSREWQEPIYCHRVVLAARSPYFRKLLQKQMLYESWWEHSRMLMTLEIEGTVIPPRCMHAVLYTMYTDKVDIRRLYERSGQHGMQMGGGGPFHMRDAMMLHHIGCFIEFPRLVQGCEEIIVDNLDQNNLLQVLHWTSLSHGSQWVERQVINYIREKFTELLSSGILFELNSAQLVEVLKSDFVNAAELDILKCALRWGEHELLRRIEDREPNLLTHTAHSVSRSKTASAKRRELIASRIEELHECTAPVLACVRMQHLLPPNHELFTSAVKRGVISRPPADLLENVSDGNVHQWIKSRVGFVPPRLFQSYVDETKNILDERFAQDTDCVSLRSVHNFPRDQTWCLARHQMAFGSHGIPDALYMVGQARLPNRRRYGNREKQNFIKTANPPFQAAPPLKYIDNYHPVPDPLTMKELFNRERELRCTPTVSKVLRACIDCCHGNNELYGGRVCFGRNEFSNGTQVMSEDAEESEYCNRCTAIRLVRLFIIRERGQPDCAVDLLQRPELYYSVPELKVAMATESFTSERPSNFATRQSNLFPSKRTNMVTTQVTASTIAKSRTEVASPPQGPPIVKGPAQLGRHLSEVVNQTPSTISERTCVLDTRQSFFADTFSSSSSGEQASPKIRRKKRSISRKGSASTTSYHSIPDVAASANSSLQRMRASSQGAALSTSVSPQVVNTAREYEKLRRSSLVLEPPHFQARDTFDSPSSTSCEENTSENEEDTDFNFQRKLEDLSNFTDKEFHLTTHPTLTHLPETAELHMVDCSDIPGTSFGIRNLPCNDKRASGCSQSVKLRHQGAGISELFTSNLNFIDDNNDSDGDTSCPDEHDALKTDQICSAAFQSNMPELVKDGTLPKGAQGCSFSSLGKPDIYPSGDDISAGDSEEQCGKYFFCSLTRTSWRPTEDKSLGSNSITKTKTSFSFAINGHAKDDKDTSSDKMSQGRENNHDQLQK